MILLIVGMIPLTWVFYHIMEILSCDLYLPSD